MIRGLFDVFAKNKTVRAIQIFDQATGLPYALNQHGSSNYTVTFYAHATPEDTPTTNLITAHAVTITDAANGIISLALTASDTALPAGQKLIEGFWQLRLVSQDGTRDFLTIPAPFRLRRNLVF